MLTDEDRAWLVALNEEIWPPFVSGSVRTKRTIELDANRKLLHEEVDRICDLIEKAPLLTEMSSKGMFGGFAMVVYEHPEFPGLPPKQLLMIIEDHLPAPKGPSVYDHIAGTAKPLPPQKRPAPGCGMDEAWELFSRYTHSKRNAEWLREYKMREPRERSSYDY